METLHKEPAKKKADNECLYCREKLKSGRTDRRFCDDSCRSAFHNVQKAEDNKEMKRVHLILKKNRKVIKVLLGDERELIVSREQLLKRGFEFDYHTHYVTSSIGKYEYTFCYNYGYRLMSEGRYKIVKGFKA